MTIQCPKCYFENPDDTLFCGKCGIHFPSPEEADVTKTLETSKEDLTPRPSDSGTSSWDSMMHGRFLPGTMLAGGQVTEQSDIYSLGLILFEVFTGKPAFDADSKDELLKLRERSSPVAPSAIVSDIDPVVERVIQRCLEKEPQERPRLALTVAAALPGGDPLAAALAAGETPSPEMVAAASESGRLHPRVAIAWLAALLLGLIVAAFLADKATVLGKAGLWNGLLS